MSLNLEKNRARMTVSVRGWNDAVIDSGEGETEEGDTLEDYVNDLDYDPTSDPDFDPYDIPGYDPDTGLDYDLTYDFGEEFNWDALAEDLDINLDIDGNIDVDQMENLTQEIANLATNEEAIYKYMTDHGDSSGIPARIRVTNPPDKLEYKDGDEIDFSGIVVCAYSSLTTRTPFIRQEWDGPRHNQIPFDQLTFPVTTADRNGSVGSAGSVGSGEDDDTGLPSYLFMPIGDGDVSTGPAIMEDGLMIWDNKGYGKEYVKRKTTYAKVGVFTNTGGSSGYIYVFAAKKDTEKYVYRCTDYYDGGYSRGALTLSSKYISLIYTTSYCTSNFYPIGMKIHTSRNEVLNAMLDGKWEPETQPVEVSIPVQWQTDYREEPYEASFDIQVT